MEIPHNEVVKKFASALFCLVGRIGYNLLQMNLGAARPSINNVQRHVSSIKIVEGQFYFKELKAHLPEWCAPLFVNINIDDIHIKHYVEYDLITDRFIGFCLPQKNAIPDAESFKFQTFEEIKSVLRATRKPSMHIA